MAKEAYKTKKGTELVPTDANKIAASNVTDDIIRTHDFYCSGVVCGEACGAKMSPCTREGKYNYFAAMGNTCHKKGCIYDESGPGLGRRVATFVAERGKDWTPEKMEAQLLKVTAKKASKSEAGSSKRDKSDGEKAKKQNTEFSLSDRAPRTVEELLYTLQNLLTTEKFGESGKTVGQLIADKRTISICRKNGIHGEYRLVIAKKLTEVLFDDSARTVRLRDAYPDVKGETWLTYDLACESEEFFKRLKEYFKSKGPNARFAFFGYWEKDTRPPQVKGGDRLHYQCSMSNGYVCKVAKMNAIYSWEEKVPTVDN